MSVPCAYCERPLVCEGCGEEYLPPTVGAYQALSRTDVTVVCPACEAPLVCHWCKTPYEEADGDAPES